ncbi:MAG: 16S rRNA (adenine(1518)-N(6)/adenine(1519)-N(6))-dimethyltransferase RsmA [Woeseiaceae bacterium]|nr:16S rRNA (adenine(1518)-N(6)/adenine(1519)-N(6))-dimethyltransferase RsmA [Woeseiaceae bacterium]
MKAHRARKRFGQHFLVDPGVIDAIVSAISPQAADTLVEIGPGPGAITAPLAARCDNFHAIELDRDLAANLRAVYAGDPGVSIHEADALSYDFSGLGKSLRIVGNLPYNISTPLLFHLVRHRSVIADMHFMLQKEVVDRMAATPGNKAYGRLTIVLGCYFEIDALFDVDRNAFDPPPKVTSAVVRLRPLPENRILLESGAPLSRIVATAFSQRRKTLRNALKTVASETELEALGIDPGLRPENIAIADWIALANSIDRDPDNRD